MFAPPTRAVVVLPEKYEPRVRGAEITSTRKFAGRLEGAGFDSGIPIASKF